MTIVAICLEQEFSSLNGTVRINKCCASNNKSVASKYDIFERSLLSLKYLHY